MKKSTQIKIGLLIGLYFIGRAFVSFAFNL